MARGGLGLLVLLLGACQGEGPPAAAPAPDLERERAEFARWLETAPASPFRALVQYPVSEAVTLGPAGSDIPLEGLGAYRIEPDGNRLLLLVGGAPRPLWRDRLVSLGSYQLLAAGPPGRTTLTVFGTEARGFTPPAYYPVAAAWRFEVELAPARSPGRHRLLGPDGSELEATEAGTVTFPAGGGMATLRVYRMPLPGGEESELEIYFRDETNGAGTYPAGRFVSLLPAGGRRYTLDFNRARNPFCAYSAVFPCPAPWRGNRVPAAVEAGERYAGGGLEVTPPPEPDSAPPGP